MVDNILTLQNCGSTSEAINPEVNAFIEAEKACSGPEEMCEVTHWKQV